MQIIDKSLDSINKIQRDCSKVLYSFQTHSASIAGRSSRIQRDVSEWECALVNLKKTQQELSLATEAYHVPPAVSQVLNEGNRQSKNIVGALKALKHSAAYLESHPSNPVGDALSPQIDEKLTKVIEIAEQTVVDMVIDELTRIKEERAINAANPVRRFGGAPVFPTRPPVSPPQNAFSSPPTFSPTAGIRRGDDDENDDDDDDLPKVQDPTDFRKEVCDGAADIVMILYNACERNDVAELLGARLEQWVKDEINAALPPTYAEDFEVPQAGLRPYTKGTHPLLKGSQAARREIEIIQQVFTKVILDPMEMDFEVVSVPPNFVENVFEYFCERITQAINVPLDGLKLRAAMQQKEDSESLPLFAIGGSCGIDLIFVVLNLIEELWKWRPLVKKTPGDPEAISVIIDDLFKTNVIELAKDLLREYHTARGVIFDRFLESNESLAPKAISNLLAGQGRVTTIESWKPPTDCMVHTLTASLVHVLKVLFGEYYGALKVVFAADILLDKASDATKVKGDNAALLKEINDMVVQESQQFIAMCIEGHFEDLEVIANTARKMALRSMNNLMAFVDLGGGSISNPPNVALLLLNNQHFVIDALRNTPSFPKALSEPIVGALVDGYQQTMEMYAVTWAAVFPPFSETQRAAGEAYGTTDLVDLDTLASIEGMDDSDPLSKEQRKAVKYWHKASCQQVEREITRSAPHALLDRSIRNQILDGAVERVKGQFDAINDDLLFSREWSRRPDKWFEPPLETLCANIRQLY